MLNVLYFYNATQTYTNTVYEHIACFGKYSQHRSFYCHLDPTTEFNLDLARFDALAFHYSIRLPYDQVSPSAAVAVSKFRGLKFLFIQDEYDNVYRAWHWIRHLGFQLVFTVVPTQSIEKIYPAKDFPNTRFVSNLTGCVPDDLKGSSDLPAPSQRELIIGYRGRPLPIRYGRLGIEKILIGSLLKAYCDQKGIRSDIAWSEKSRIYGPDWYRFMLSCRSMLGSESGSNVFDWDGTLVSRIAEFKKNNPKALDVEIYEKFVHGEERDGLMNQVSPRVFEAIAAKTVLVLFEGDYSGVVKADVHFVAVKKDGSNLVDVIRRLSDGAYVDAMAERAYQDVILSGNYSYHAFVQMIDGELEKSMSKLNRTGQGELSEAYLPAQDSQGNSITTAPLRAVPVRIRPGNLADIFAGSKGAVDFFKNILIYTWSKMPLPLRFILRPLFVSLLGRKR